MAARSLNKAMIIGNMTRDPELRYTASGTAIVTFGVATNREYTPSHSDETIEDTEFHNVVAWSKLAELCDKLLSKGQKVFIEGRLQTRNWVDEETGKKMYRTETVAEEMIVLSPSKGDGSKGDGSTTFGRPREDQAKSPSQATSPQLAKTDVETQSEDKSTMMTTDEPATTEQTSDQKEGDKIPF